MLSRIKFGRDDAESEKEFLKSVFLPTALFKRIKNNDKWLVLGRKGSGKTALGLTLFTELQERGSNVLLIEPDNFSFEAHTKLLQGSINFSEVAKLSWKYVFLTILGKHVLQSVINKEGKNYRKWTEEANKLREFLARRDDRFASWLDKALKKTGEITRFTFEFASMKAEAERTPIIPEASLLRDSLDETSQYIKKCTPKYFYQPFYILVDKIDEHWSQNPESIDLIIGLLKAAKECREQIPQSHIIIFLRSDIFDILKFDDLDKYRSISERVIWDKSNLLKLISLRINATIGEKIDPGDAWEMIFPKTINGQDSFSYLLRYTLMRPRDLIQLCNYCKDVAENHNSNKIDQKVINKALPEYSRWKLDDLVIEYKVQYPFLEKIFWNVFYRGPHRFDTEKLKKLLNPQLNQWGSEEKIKYFLPIEKLLDALYRIGFVGAVKPGNIFYFYNGIPITISDINEFVIHPAFRAALEIHESIEHIKSVKIIKSKQKDNQKLKPKKVKASHNKKSGGRENTLPPRPKSADKPPPTGG